MTENQKPDVEELYTMAQTTTNLAVDADRRGAADLLIASAWSPTRLGSAMLRLHSEWDAAAKPTKPTPAAIDALALTLPLVNGKPDKGGAYTLAGDWYSSALLNLFVRLPAMRGVLDAVVDKAILWGIQDPEEKAAAVVRYWLDQTCRPCHGLRFRLIPNAPALSNRLCPACGGSGLGQVPHGSDGRRLANYMDDCVARARTSIKKRLRHDS